MVKDKKLEGGQVKANKRGQVGNGRQTTTVKRKRLQIVPNSKVIKKVKVVGCKFPLIPQKLRVPEIVENSSGLHRHFAARFFEP